MDTLKITFDLSLALQVLAVTGIGWLIKAVVTMKKDVTRFDEWVKGHEAMHKLMREK